MRIKSYLIFILLVLLCLFISCKDNQNEPEKESVEKEDIYMLAEEEACFNFFWETQNINELSKGCGLIPDKYPSNGLASIASVGYGLAAMVIGVENEWITKEEGYDRALLTLTKLKDMERVNGFYYHFYKEKIGGVASESEISNIDTSIFLCGALVAGEYFQGDVEIIANEIYDEVNWTWFVNPKTNNFYMSYNSSTNKFSGEWDYYAEQLMMYFLAAGSKTHPIEKKVYDSFTRHYGTYGEYTFINSWFGALFTYQFSHAFIDFRNLIDDKGINWFDNSVLASKANYKYCCDNPENFNTFLKDQWGITACQTPTGYSGLLGSLPSGNNSKKFTNDGTIAPAGAIGSIVFVPELVMPCFKNYSTMLDGGLIGVYGYQDGFNFDGQKPWIASSVIGIDKGISIVMIENYRSELIWSNFMNLDLMNQAIEVLGFEVTNE